MTTKLPGIPPVPAGVDRSLKTFLDSLKESLEVRLGIRGDKLDQAVTLRDLRDGGIADVHPQTWGLAPAGTLTSTAGGIGGNTGTGAGGSANLEAPTGLTVIGGFAIITLTWNSKVPANWSATEIYWNTYDSLQTAKSLRTVTSNGYVDPVTDEITRYYWIRFIFANGQVGPFNSTNGTPGTPQKNVDVILESVIGSIMEDHLTPALGQRITNIETNAGLIEANIGATQARIDEEIGNRLAQYTDTLNKITILDGSTTTRIISEQFARQTADAAEATARLALEATVTSNYSTVNAAITNEATARATADTGLANQISLLTAGVAGGFDPAQIWYFDSTVENWTATGTTLSQSGGWLVMGTMTANAVIFLASDFTAILGSQYAVISLRIKRTAGSGWTGKAEYKLQGAGGFSANYKQITTDPVPTVGDTNTIQFDMTSLTVGGNDWITHSIVNIRLTLGATSADKFEIDWIGIGRNAPGASQAGLLAEQTARAAADSALTTSVTSLTAQVNTKNTIFRQASAPTAYATGDLWFDTSNNNQAYRWDGAAWVLTDNTLIATTAAGLTTEQTARATADTALSNSITTLTATVNSNNTTINAALASESSARATADTALTTKIDLLTAHVGTVGASLADEQTARATADAALASNVTLLQAKTADTNAAILLEQTVRATADTAEATARTTLSSKVTGLADPSALTLDTLSSGLLYDEKTTRTTKDTALATTIDLLQAVVGAAAARIEDITTTFSTSNTAQADRTTKVESTLNGNTAAIQVQASSINGLQAQYTVKIDNNGYVTGYGLASDATNGTPKSTFMVRADRFAVTNGTNPRNSITAGNLTRTSTTATLNFTGIGSTLGVGDWFELRGYDTPSGDTTANPPAGWNDVWQVLTSAANSITFTVPAGLTATPTFTTSADWTKVITPFVILTATDANGNPPGVYMNEAFIKIAAIGTAQIQDASITNAKIVDLSVDSFKVAGNAVSAPYYFDGIAHSPWTASLDQTIASSATIAPPPGGRIRIVEKTVLGVSWFAGTNILQITPAGGNILGAGDFVSLSGFTDNALDVNNGGWNRSFKVVSGTLTSFNIQPLETMHAPASFAGAKIGIPVGGITVSVAVNADSSAFGTGRLFLGRLVMEFNNSGVYLNLPIANNGQLWLPAGSAGQGVSLVSNYFLYPPFSQSFKLHYVGQLTTAATAACDITASIVVEDGYR